MLINLGPDILQTPDFPGMSEEETSSVYRELFAEALPDNVVLDSAGMISIVDGLTEEENQEAYDEVYAIDWREFRMDILNDNGVTEEDDKAWLAAKFEDDRIKRLGK